MYTIDQVIDHLYIGNEAASSRKELLRRHQISHVLVVGFGLKKHFQDTFCYKQVDMLDTPTYQIQRHFAECNTYIDSALSSGGSVFVHCFQGVSRSPTVVCAYLIYKNGLTAIQAQRFLKEKHFDSAPNYGFSYQLTEYENLLRRGQVCSPEVKDEDKVYCKCVLF